MNKHITDLAISIAELSLAKYFVSNDTLTELPLDVLQGVINGCTDDVKEMIYAEGEEFEQTIIRYMFKKLDYLTSEGFTTKNENEYGTYTYHFISDKDQEKILRDLVNY